LTQLLLRLSLDAATKVGAYGRQEAQRMSDYLHDLRRALETRGNLARLARLSELSGEALRKIADGRTANPGIRTVERIQKALESVSRDSLPEILAEQNQRGNREKSEPNQSGAESPVPVGEACA
jgi:DNA-binding phage protein